MRKRILLFEPSLADQAFFRAALEIDSVDSELIVAGNLTETMAYLSGSEYFKDRASFPLPDFCFVTVKNAEPVGFHLLDWIRSDLVLQRMKVIACADSRDLVTVQRASDSAFDAVLGKPFSSRELHVAFEQSLMRVPVPLESDLRD